MRIKAREFAIAAHGDQKYGDHPYSVHLDAVASIASRHGETAEVIAYLHDVVEDTSVPLGKIQEEFGQLVADAVSVLTDEPGRNRKERKSKTYKKMANVTGKTQVALVVKAADRLANLRACVADNNQSLLAMYKNEHKVFKESVFRPNFCNEIWEEIEEILDA